jgi:hypothetical protein
MFFQTLDDKTECVGIYKDGKLFFDKAPDDLKVTWSHSQYLESNNTEYVSLWTGGKDIFECCPDEHIDELKACKNKLKAYLKSFQIAKINMNDHCMFDLIPHDFLLRFCEAKNKVTEYVYNNWDKPEHYQHLKDVHVLLSKIKHQKLNLVISDCKHLFVKTRDRNKINELLSNHNYIDYNLFGTVTGRLTTNRNSFPILTLKKDVRQIIKPNNDLFVSLDYNGAEIRTLLELSGEQQPDIDIHEWNSKHLFEQEIERDECKVRFFAWLYDPESNDVKNSVYDKEKVLDKWYKNGYITTPYGRKILVEKRKALNYLLQSTTSDRVLSKAVKIDEYLTNNDCKSYISHIVHDELVIDYSDTDRDHLEAIKEIFHDGYLVNVKAGKDYLNLKELNV